MEFFVKLELAPKESVVELNWEDAMLYCRLLNIEGKSDWRLPTKEEMDYLYQNLYVCDFKWTYWTSTEQNTNYAWYHCFNPMTNGFQNNVHKNRIISVRAVRSL